LIGSSIARTAGSRRAMPDDADSAHLLNAQARDELQDASDRSREAGLHDALTGLPNRVLLAERMRHAFLRSRRSGTSSAVLFVDLDRFKAVNDTYGRRIGDELLVAVARRLSGLLRPHDTLARLSGDQFVVFCDDLDSPAQAGAIAARIDVALTRPFLLSDTVLDLTASIGIAFAGRGEPTADRLIQDADVAMYDAKRLRGGPHHSVRTHHGDHLAGDDAALRQDLRAAISQGQLYLDYQPIVATGTARITGFEALLRWVHHARGPVPPSILIPLAERCDLINQSGAWVLHRAWTDRHRWHTDHQYGDELVMSVNVSARQLMAAGFAATVEAVLASSDTPARLLTLEITESVFISDSQRALLVLDDLKDLGVTLALDDFGTGFSSLSHLKRFPIDIIKIDKTFISDLGRDPVCRAVVAAIVQLAHGLGKTVVAEGIETAEQHTAVLALGADACQGFYFARPDTANHTDALIEDIRHRPDGSLLAR
jgi:diguanylate cyclase (GGDEF)-like protein